MDEKETETPPDSKEWQRIDREVLAITAAIVGPLTACAALLAWGESKSKEGYEVEYYLNRKSSAFRGYIRKDSGSKDACHKA